MGREQPIRDMSAQYGCVMVEIRPTLQTLKALRSADLLASADASAYDNAKRADEAQLTLNQLVKLDLSRLNVNLLNDPRTLVEDGKLPNTHKASSRAARESIYELRDHSGGAWRGAGVLDGVHEVLWVVLAMPHDHFHKQAAEKIETFRKAGRLGPSQLDLTVLELDRTRIDRKINRIAVLSSLIDALKASLRHGAPTQVLMPSVVNLEHVEMFVTLSEVPTDPEDWDPSIAHEDTGMITVEIELNNMSAESRKWLLRTCLPFLQEDQAMIETHFRKTLSSLVLLPQSKLMQLLTLDESDFSSAENVPLLEPTHLHYTAKSGLTEAYVEGKAVRAICGFWWVPVGDDHTHNDLPVCEECETERPFAETVSKMLNQRGSL